MSEIHETLFATPLDPSDKFGENQSIHTGDIVESNPKNRIFCIFGHAVTTTFDPKNLTRSFPSARTVM